MSDGIDEYNIYIYMLKALTFDESKYRERTIDVKLNYLTKRQLT